MGQLTLFKLQYKQYKKIKDKFSASEGMIYLSDDDTVRFQDVLALLEFKGYIREFQIDGTNAYRRMASVSATSSSKAVLAKIIPASSRQPVT